jgi:hypothetical protein
MAKTFPILFGDKIKSGTQLDVNVKSISFNTNTLQYLKIRVFVRYCDCGNGIETKQSLSQETTLCPTLINYVVLQSAPFMQKQQTNIKHKTHLETN